MLNNARSIEDARQNAWRVRAAVVLDFTIGVATLVMLVLGVPGMSRLAAPFGYKLSNLLPFFVLFAGSALLLGVIVRLAQRGQTIGLSVTGLRWTSLGIRSPGRRVLGEPQFWCTSLPAAYILLNASLNIVLQRDWPVIYSLPIVYLFPLLVSCAVLLMVTFRRQPGYLVSR